MNVRSSHLMRAAVLGCVGLALCACSSLRSAAGMDKSAPDEFAVLTKAPLVIPPDYNLKPPKPGASPVNQTDPSESAQTALFGNDAATIASNITGNYSDGEKMLLAQAGIANADPNIRIHLQSDRKAMIGADDSFTNEVLFWKGPKTDPGTAVDADAEAKRIDAQKAGQGPRPDAPKKDEDRGWFDGWFDWF